nr:MAG TPA: hypothetical protein [Caudoviricetes sp.]
MFLKLTSAIMICVKDVRGGSIRQLKFLKKKLEINK